MKRRVYRDGRVVEPAAPESVVLYAKTDAELVAYDRDEDEDHEEEE